MAKHHEGKRCRSCEFIAEDQNGYIVCKKKGMSRISKERNACDEYVLATEEMECRICGKKFTRLRGSSKLTCSDECDKERRKRRMLCPQPMDDTPAMDAITKLNTEARNNGMSYGQLQAQKLIEQERRKSNGSEKRV